MYDTHALVEELRAEFSEQAAPQNLPKHVVPALLTAAAFALARQVTQG